jgi:hypothetical protein
MRGGDTWLATLVEPDTIELDVPSKERYLFSTGRDGRVAYLHSVADGCVWYRNEPPLAGPTTISGPRTGTYAACSWGVPTIWFRIRHDDFTPVIERVRAVDEPDAPPVALQLAALTADLYLSSVGDVLDFSDGTRYGNVELTRVDDAS